MSRNRDDVKRAAAEVVRGGRSRPVLDAEERCDCIGRSSKDAFWKFIQGTFDAQSSITEANADEKFTAIADTAGVKGADMAACAAKADTKTRVEQSVALGQSVGVTGTPTVFVNGRRIGNVVGLPPEVLKGLVEFAAKQ